MPQCTSSPPAPVMARGQTNPAAQSLHRQRRHTAVPGAAAQVCRGNLGARSLARGRLHFAPAQADQHQRLADLARRFRRIYKTSPMPLRCPPRAAERRYLGKIRRLRVFRTTSIRGREKAGLQLPILYDRCELPGIARAPTGDQGLNTTHRFVPGNGSALCDLDTPGRARSTGVDAGHALRVDRRRAGLFSRHRLFAHRRSLRVSRRPAGAHQKNRREFLMASG